MTHNRGMKMIDYNLKNKIDDTFRMLDDIQNRTPELTASTGMTLREMLKYNLLQYVGFLFESDGTDGRQELEFIRDYLGSVMTITQFLNFKYGKCMDKNFINMPPRCMLYLAKSDLSEGAVKSPAGRPVSKEVVELYNEIGTAFVAVNGESVTELANMSNYSLMLDNFLKEYGLYFTDGVPKGRINPKSRNLRGNKTGRPNNINSRGSANAGTASNSAKTPSASGDNGSEEKEETLEQMMEELNSLVGLKSVKQDLTNLINLVKVRKLREERGMKQPDITLHLVFSGNPGTGKTTVARLLAKIYKVLGVVSEGQLVEVDRSNLVAGYIGQTATQTAEIVESAIGGILFIDEAYTLIKSGDEKDFGQEAVDTLLKMMEDNRDDLIVIVAGYTDKMEEFVNSNPGLKSRFSKNIDFPDYSADELTLIFKKYCRDNSIYVNSHVLSEVRSYFEKETARKKGNYGNARSVRNYFESILVNQADRLVKSGDMSHGSICNITLEDLPKRVKINNMNPERR